MDEIRNYTPREKRVLHEPHNLEGDVDPVKENHSEMWYLCFYTASMMFLLDVLAFFLTLNRHVIFKFWVINSLTPFLFAGMIIIPVVWLLVAGSQQRLDDNINHVKFINRERQHKESFSKYDNETPQEVIEEFTGMTDFDEVTGISTHLVNESNWVLQDHPYGGNRAVDYLVTIETAEEEEVFLANLYEAGKALREKEYFIKHTLFAGQSLTYVLDNIENELAKPNLSDVRQKALYSIYNHYSGRPGNNEPLYLIHAGLPYSPTMEKAIEDMKELHDKLVPPYKEMGITMIQIKEKDIVKSILDGIFTGKMWFDRSGVIARH
jgi:hypothetical protein